MSLFAMRRAISDFSDSIEEDLTKKSRRPPNTAFRQQRLKAWQPILSPQSVLPLLIIVSAIFAPIGIGLIISVNNVQDLVINYSDCQQIASADRFSTIPNKYVNYHFKKKIDTKPVWKLETRNNEDFCQIEFEIPNDIESSVYVYYKLTNFYQNHRKYVSSFDFNQLEGKAVDLNTLTSNCDPLKQIGDKIVYPCGLIANSIFNDTFSHTLKGINETEDYQLSNKGISWKIDRQRYKKTTYNYSQIIPPPNWIKKYPNGFTENNIPDISQWEELQVWMRTAGLPKFYKLALKNETVHLPKGKYMMEIGINYPVSMFGGTKSFVLTTNSIIGGRNMSLGIVYLIVAGIAILFGVIFLAKLIIQPRKLGDHSYLNFDDENEPSVPSSMNDQYTTAPIREIL